MTMNIILWLSVIWLPPFLYVMTKNEANFKKNIAVGVTMPWEGREDSEVQARLARYVKQQKYVCWGLLAAGVLCFFLVRDTIASLTVFLIWTDLVVILPNVPFVLCNRDLHAIKAARGWRQQPARTRTVDLAAVPEPHQLPAWYFLPPLVVSLLPAFWMPQNWILFAVDGACILLFWLCYRFAYRNRAELVDENSDLTRTLTRVRRHAWGQTWLFSSWTMAALNLILALTARSPSWMLAGILAMCALIGGGVFYVELRTRRIQEKLTADSGRSWYLDEDDKWIWGLFYYDPDDKRFMVNNRVGTNTTMNLAKRPAQILMALLALLLLALPLFGVWLGDMGSRPIDLTVTGTTLTCVSGRDEYEIPLSSIEQVTLREDLPDNLIRTWGTGMDTYLEGMFSAGEGIGVVKLCLDPGVGPYLYLDTTDGNYLFGSRDPAVTRQAYEKLQR